MLEEAVKGTAESARAFSVGLVFFRFRSQVDCFKDEVERNTIHMQGFDCF